MEESDNVSSPQQLYPPSEQSQDTPVTIKDMAAFGSSMANKICDTFDRKMNEIVDTIRMSQLQ